MGSFVVQNKMGIYFSRDFLILNTVVPFLFDYLYRTIGFVLNLIHCNAQWLPFWPKFPGFKPDLTGWGLLECCMLSQCSCGFYSMSTKTETVYYKWAICPGCILPLAQLILEKLILHKNTHKNMESCIWHFKAFLIFIHRAIQILNCVIFHLQVFLFYLIGVFYSFIQH